MTEQNPEALVVDPALDSPEAIGLTPPEQITVMTVQVNALGASQWSYSISHEDAAKILREVAEQIDLKAAAQHAESVAAEEERREAEGA